MAFGLSERLNNNLNVELMYAQTIGNNSGAISGKNSDGTSDQSRLSLSLRAKF